MSRSGIILLKTVLHILCLIPFLWLVHVFTTPALLGSYADPINYITHFTGDWTLYTLFASLAITPIRRLSPRSRGSSASAVSSASTPSSTQLSILPPTSSSSPDTTSPPPSLVSRTGHPGEVVTQWKLIWPRMVDDALKRRFIQVGLFAWLILLSLAVTSPTFILRAMGGKNWQRLHRLVYVAAISGIIHYWWMVKSGNYAPWKVTAVLTVLLLARIVYALIKRRQTLPVTSG